MWVLFSRVDLNVANFLLSLDSALEVTWWQILVSRAVVVGLVSAWIGPLSFYAVPW